MTDYLIDNEDLNHILSMGTREMCEYIMDCVKQHVDTGNIQLRYYSYLGEVAEILVNELYSIAYVRGRLEDIFWGEE